MRLILTVQSSALHAARLGAQVNRLLSGVSSGGSRRGRENPLCLCLAATEEKSTVERGFAQVVVGML